MFFVRLGLLFDFIGALLLGFHILGSDRLIAIEKWLRSLPKVPFNSLNTLHRRAVQFYFDHFSLNDQVISRTLSSIYQRKVNFNIKDWRDFHYNFPLLYIAVFIIFIGYVLMTPIYFVIFLLIALPVALLKIGFFFRDRFKLESIFGLIGIVFLILGFIFQWWGSFRIP